MARVRTDKPPEPEGAEPQERSAGGGETSPGGHGRRRPASKSEAVRMTIAAGFDGPQEGSGYIKSQFGLDVSPQHFSSIKSQMKSKGLEAQQSGRRSRAPVEGYLAPPPKAGGDGPGELLAAMEAIKPLVASLGADKVKRIVDLLG